MMNYQNTLRDIERIALECKRDPKEITLIAVSKYAPFEKVMEAYHGGCRNFGESRPQEALVKIEQSPKDIKWHLIGTLQKNKVNKAIGHFSLIHSVDSFDLAKKISAASEKASIATPILIQVNISGEESKHGLSKEEWRNCFNELIQLPNLELHGLMTMAPLTEDKNIVRKTFSSLREFREELLPKVIRKELFKELSMGMSHDYPIAIEEGATMVRIGSKIFAE